jgi:hypothetical protein
VAAKPHTSAKTIPKIVFVVFVMKYDV